MSKEFKQVSGNSVFKRDSGISFCKIKYVSVIVTFIEINFTYRLNNKIIPVFYRDKYYSSFTINVFINGTFTNSLFVRFVKALLRMYVPQSYRDITLRCVNTVSYTHLDVYKRQPCHCVRTKKNIS